MHTKPAECISYKLYQYVDLAGCNLVQIPAIPKKTAEDVLQFLTEHVDSVCGVQNAVVLINETLHYADRDTKTVEQIQRSDQSSEDYNHLTGQCTSTLKQAAQDVLECINRLTGRVHIQHPDQCFEQHKEHIQNNSFIFYFNQKKNAYRIEFISHTGHRVRYYGHNASRELISFLRTQDSIETLTQEKLLKLLSYLQPQNEFQPTTPTEAYGLPSALSVFLRIQEACVFVSDLKTDAVDENARRYSWASPVLSYQLGRTGVPYACTMDADVCADIDALFRRCAQNQPLTLKTIEKLHNKISTSILKQEGRAFQITQAYQRKKVCASRFNDENQSTLLANTFLYNAATNCVGFLDELRSPCEMEVSSALRARVDQIFPAFGEEKVFMRRLSYALLKTSAVLNDNFELVESLFTTQYCCILDGAQALYLADRDAKSLVKIEQATPTSEIKRLRRVFSLPSFADEVSSVFEQRKLLDLISLLTHQELIIVEPLLIELIEESGVFPLFSLDIDVPLRQACQKMNEKNQALLTRFKESLLPEDLEKFLTHMQCLSSWGHEMRKKIHDLDGSFIQKLDNEIQAQLQRIDNILQQQKRDFLLHKEDFQNFYRQYTQGIITSQKTTMLSFSNTLSMSEIHAWMQTCLEELSLCKQHLGYAQTKSLLRSTALFTQEEFSLEKEKTDVTTQMIELVRFESHVIRQAILSRATKFYTQVDRFFELMHKKEPHFVQEEIPRFLSQIQKFDLLLILKDLPKKKELLNRQSACIADIQALHQKKIQEFEKKVLESYVIATMMTQQKNIDLLWNELIYTRKSELHGGEVQKKIDRLSILLEEYINSNVFEYGLCDMRLKTILAGYEHKDFFQTKQEENQIYMQQHKHHLGAFIEIRTKSFLDMPDDEHDSHESDDEHPYRRVQSSYDRGFNGRVAAERAAANAAYWDARKKEENQKMAHKKLSAFKVGIESEIKRLEKSWGGQTKRDALHNMMEAETFSDTIHKYFAALENVVNADGGNDDNDLISILKQQRSLLSFFSHTPTKATLYVEEKARIVQALEKGASLNEVLTLIFSQETERLRNNTSFFFTNKADTLFVKAKNELINVENRALDRAALVTFTATLDDDEEEITQELKSAYASFWDWYFDHSLNVRIQEKLALVRGFVEAEIPETPEALDIHHFAG